MGVPCTGFTASWCPNHGDCNCEQEHDGTMDYEYGLDPECPLHADVSRHAQMPVVQEADLTLETRVTAEGENEFRWISNWAPYTPVED